MPEPTMTKELFVVHCLADLKPMTEERQQAFLDRIDALLAAERKRCADLAEFNHKHDHSLNIARAIRSLT